MITTVLVFIIVLAVLILVHEAGHFFAAKWTGMRVDEFGLGFPPQATSYTPEGSETTYSLNWLPFGGFVKIFGENLEEVDADHPDSDRSFAQQTTGSQVIVLVAGVVMNMLLAYVLLSAAFMLGKTVANQPAGQAIQNQRVVITQTSPDSPAKAAGLEAGHQLESVSAGDRYVSATSVTPAVIQGIVDSATNSPVIITTKQGEKMSRATVTPEITESGDQRIGIVMAEVGTVTLGPLSALKQGAVATANLTEQTVVGFYNLIRRSVSGAGDLSQVAGPVGIADLVGDAADRGLAPLLSFIALISINLAILNLLPFPALDGGRIAFSLAEWVRGKPLPPRFAQWANGIGIALLLLFMLVVTYNDIIRLF